MAIVTRVMLVLPIPNLELTARFLADGYFGLGSS